MHVYNGYPLYLPEAMDRWHSYPPPASGGFYVVPWLWIDGNQHGGYLPALWENMILDRLNQPASVNINITGYYSPANMTGMVYANLRNDSTSAISGFALFVVTEDSIYFPAPNFDSIHNHVARDFLPDHIGAPVTIPPGDSVTVSQPFTVRSGWNTSQCRIIAWLQDTVLLPDSTKNIYQSSMIRIADLAVSEENKNPPKPTGIKVMPNPAEDRLRLVFDVPRTVCFKITLFDITGRRVSEMNGVGSGGGESVGLDLRDRRIFKSGVYFYLLQSAAFSASGKFVLR